MVNIMIVEDEKPISNLIALSLKKVGYHCECAYDGLSAIDMIEKKYPDLILLDIMLPGADGFAPLAKVSGDKKVVLGLVTTKTPELEDKEKVIARIHEAAKYVPLDRLYLSPQCGFASCEIGNKLTEEQQWAKLKLVKEIAEEVWG